MNEALGLVEPSFADAADPALFDLGRPRTLLSIAARAGGRDPLGETAESARRAGATITRASLDDLGLLAARFEAVVVDGAVLGPTTTAASLRAIADRVDDGGRLLAPCAGDRVVEVIDATTRADLRAPRASRHGAPFGAERVVVARRPARAAKLSLTIGMLTLDEERAIAPMIDEVRAIAPDAKLLIVDGSSDATPDIARDKGARVVRQLPARGHAAAMRRLMYEAAAESDALIYLDCDCTYPPGEIPRLRARLEAGAEVVNATRTHHRPAAMPLAHFAANRLFAATARVAHGLPTPDLHSGMRGYRASLIRAFDFDGRGDALPIDTLLLPARAGARVEDLAIDYRPRVGESKLARVRGTVWTFVRLARALERGARVSGRA